MNNEIKMIDFEIPESETHFVKESDEYRAHFLQADEAGSVFAELVPSVNYIGWNFDIEPYPISVDAIPISAFREIKHLIKENKRLREKLNCQIQENSASQKFKPLDYVEIGRLEI